MRNLKKFPIRIAALMLAGVLTFTSMPMEAFATEDVQVVDSEGALAAQEDEDSNTPVVVESTEKTESEDNKSENTEGASEDSGEGGEISEENVEGTEETIEGAKEGGENSEETIEGAEETAEDSEDDIEIAEEETEDEDTEADVPEEENTVEGSEKDEPIEYTTEVYVNPLYADIVTEDELLELIDENPGGEVESLGASFSDAKSASNYIMQQMVNRESTFTVTVSGSANWNSMLTAAYATYNNSTGKTGDALKFQFGGASGTYGGGTYNYNVKYYTTKAQENALNSKVTSILSSINSDSTIDTDVERVKAVHDYLVNNIVYTKTSDMTCYTAYGALVAGKCVCQGYAVAFYRLCKDLGVDARVISGQAINHAWNIVGLDDIYYNMDCTWDDPVGGNGSVYYTYYLKSDPNFSDHPRDAEYKTDSFYDRYPMALADYGKTAEVGATTAPAGDNRTNTTYTFNTIDGKTVTSDAVSKPKLLVFYNTTCGNSMSVIKTLGGMNLSNVDVVAIETKSHTLDEVKAFKNSYAPKSSIVFTYDTDADSYGYSKSSKAMFAYADVNSITWPVMVYIDENNKVQTVTIGYQSKTQISDNLRYYCDGEIEYYKYKIIYKPNGGKGKDKTVQWTTEDWYTVEDNPNYTNAKLAFIGWNSKADGSGTTYEVGQKITSQATIFRLYAQWKPNHAIATTMKPSGDDKLTLVAGTTSTIESTITTENPKYECSDDIVWKSSNTGVAKVDATGKVTGVKAGTAEITFTAGDITKTCTVEVIPALTLDKTLPRIKLAGTETISVETVPTFGQVEWASSDDSIATITPIGTGGDGYKSARITATGSGKATITATVGEKSVSTVVTVWEGISSISIDTPEITKLLVGQSTTLNFTTGPVQGIAVGTENWTVSQPAYLDIEPNISAHNAVITAQGTPGSGKNVNVTVSLDGYTSAAQKITVTDQIVLDGNGGTVKDSTGNTSSSMTAKYGDSYAELLNNYTAVKDGYVFAGWYTQPNADIPAGATEADIVTVGNKISSNSVITGSNPVYARFKEVGAGEMWVSPIGDYTFTGGAIKPVADVYDGTTPLTLGQDYTVSYKNNTKAYELTEGQDGFDPKKAPQVIITGKNGYSSKVTAYFTISQKSISDSDVVAPDMAAIYTRKVQKIAPAVTWGKIKLKANTDYTMAIKDKTGTVVTSAINPGAYTVTLTGNGNYKGTKTLKFTVTQDKLAAKLTIVKIPNQNYFEKNPSGTTGVAIEPEVTVKDGKETLTEGTDYVVEYKNQYSVGTATVTITGRGAYIGSKSATYKIVGTPISKARLDDNKLLGATFNEKGALQPYIYTGAELKPAGEEDVAKDTTPVEDGLLYVITAKNAPQVNLIKGVDYKVSYQKNVNKGTATMVFTGINGYTGTLKKTFRINAYGVADNSKTNESSNLVVNVTSKDAAGYNTAVYSKGGAKPTIILTYKGNLLTENKDYTIKYKNNGMVYSLKEADSEFDPRKAPQFTISGKGNFAGTAVTEYFTITPADLQTRTTMTAADKVYNGKPGMSTAVKLIDVDGKVLKAGTDYEKELKYFYNSTPGGAATWVEYTDDTVIEPGTQMKVVATAKDGGNYTGTNDTTFKVAYSISKAKVTVAPQIYTGGTLGLTEDDMTVAVPDVGNLVYGRDFTISVPEALYTKVGTGKVTITGMGNYTGTKVVTYKIVKKTLKLGLE